MDSQIIKNFLNGIKSCCHRNESIESWARREGLAKQIEHLYNPADPHPEDVDYLEKLHKNDKTTDKTAEKDTPK